MSEDMDTEVQDVELWGWSVYFDTIKVFLLDLERKFGNCNLRYADYAVERLDICIGSVLILLDYFNAGLQGPSFFTPEGTRHIIFYRGQLEELTACLQQIKAKWQVYKDSLDANGNSQHAYRATAMPTGAKGRPRFQVTQEQLEYLCSLSFSWSEIASLLGISRMTLFRCRREYNMVDNPRQSISDDQLRTLITHLRVEMPSVGETMVMGHCRSNGYNVTRNRIRQAIHATDPINTTLRWKGNLSHRRPYSVPGPNSLWHIDLPKSGHIYLQNHALITDGHHKLIRWRFVTHAGIDGYSRLIVFMHCSDNNRSTTVHKQFLEATRLYGLPSRVRTDQGKENMKIAEHMLENRGVNRASVITGSSVHNQRIERLWKDMFQSVIITYYRLFYYLEQQYLLDPLNELHLFSLHYVYMPRINRALHKFRDAWNHHSLRTEHNSTPYQLFTSGVLRLRHAGIVALDFLEDIDDQYGIEHTHFTVDHDENEDVVIPPINIQVNEHQIRTLQETVNPLADSDNYGIEMYEQALNCLTT